MKPILILIVATMLFSGCVPEDRELEIALELAGENRIELEKVLRHYSSPKDSLKYRAAIFLIKNMPYHLGYYSEKFARYDAVADSMYSQCHYDSFAKSHIINGNIRQQIFRQILDFYKQKLGSVDPINFNRKNDINEMQAELLIENIEYAFKAWNFPWSRNYSFEQFCNYILPYRYGQEPLESWRPFFMKQLYWISDTVRKQSDASIVATVIAEWLGRNLYYNYYFDHLRGKDFKCSNFLKTFTANRCDDMAGYYVCCMRAMGIPSAVVNIPKWGNRNQGHSVCAFLNMEGNWTCVMADENQPVADIQLRDYYVPKIFINHFDILSRKIDPEIYRRLPHLIFTKDITCNYMNTANIVLDWNSKMSQQKYAFVCTFDRPNWQPVDWAEINHGKIVFENLGTNMVYLPVVYNNNKMVPISDPIKVSMNGEISIIKPDPKNKTTHLFNRKYPFSYTYPNLVKQRCEDLVGGKFESGNNHLFNDGKILHSIKDIPSYYPVVIEIDKVKTKFVRYCFPKIARKPQDGPAQIAFFTSKNNELKRLDGKYFGCPGMTEENLKRLFDDDILTFVSCYPYESSMGKNTAPSYILYRCSQDSIWAGMEFEKEETITHIGFCPRNDKNCIYPGMSYELLYWNKKWESLGIEVAQDSVITFGGIPKDALLWLRNLDEGEAERILTIDNGKVFWW